MVARSVVPTLPDSSLHFNLAVLVCAARNTAVADLTENTRLCEFANQRSALSRERERSSKRDAWSGIVCWPLANFVNSTGAKSEVQKRCDLSPDRRWLMNLWWIGRLPPCLIKLFSSNSGAYRILSNFPGQSGLQNRCSNRQFSICWTTHEKRRALQALGSLVRFD